jgi:hypothetical protein
LYKKKYIYYRCSFERGRHKAPYIPEARLADMLGSVLTKITIPLREKLASFDGAIGADDIARPPAKPRATPSICG